MTITYIIRYYIANLHIDDLIKLQKISEAIKSASLLI